ncbi:hypothetical protein F511_17019 [Dorcoceras hygrometricum]|uniref:Uncharacterized protein n=1 Tax=Dorcoceras hygrometricum TaxID=472368 RepID=A0A2Z7DDE1_9LAMI|nr:hypothetical protein F511_17019 [Dorcoceras hygrometricum]
MRLALLKSAHRLLHINSFCADFPVGHIFPAVDNSSEKVLAWMYFVSFAFNASAGYLAFSTSLSSCLRLHVITIIDIVRAC